MKRTCSAFIIIMLCFAAVHAGHLNVLFVGNSLTQGSPGCQGEGWMWSSIMVNNTTASTGVDMCVAGSMLGATTLCGHWTNGQSQAEINNPTGMNNWDPCKTTMKNAGSYDYVALQNYGWSAQEKACAIQYADLALSNGSKPIFFACWIRDTVNQPAMIRDITQLYNQYKSDGALVFPVAQAHALVWHDKSIANPVAYLYGAGDDFHHDNQRGAYLKECVFYEVLTGQSVLNYNLSSLKSSCWTGSDLDPLLPDAPYLQRIAHQAVSEFYGTTGVPNAPLAYLFSKRENHSITLDGKLLTSPARYAGAQMSVFSLNGTRIFSGPITATRLNIPGLGFLTSCIVRISAQTGTVVQRVTALSD